MGLLAKSKTKKRVAAQTGPLNPAIDGDPWMTTAAVPIGALVRSAALALGREGARSSQRRGRSSILAPSFSSSSELWVEALDLDCRNWSIALGVDAIPKGIAADWIVGLLVSEGRDVTVETSRWLTRDDELVNGRIHDELRESLLRALASAEMADPTLEDVVSASSLECSVPMEAPPPETFSASVWLSATVSAEDFQKEVLGHVGFRVLGEEPGGRRYGLGVSDGVECDHAVVTMGNGHVAVEAVVASGSPVARRMAAADLRALVRLLETLLRSCGSEVSYSGPQEWAP